DGAPARAARQYSRRQREHSAGYSGRDWPGHATFGLGVPAGGVGRLIARQQRKGGDTPQGSHTPGPSVSAARVGAMCLGDPQDLDGFGTDVSPTGGTRGEQESRGGSGAYDLGDHLPSSARRDFL